MQIAKLGNRPRPRRRARPRFIGFWVEKRADLPGNYFVPFVSLTLTVRSEIGPYQSVIF